MQKTVVKTFLVYQSILLPIRKITQKLVVIIPCLISTLILNSVTGVVAAFFDKVRNDSSFSDVRNNVGRGNRITHLYI